MAIENGQRPSPPLGFEGLSPGALQDIRRFAPGDLETLSVPQLIALRDKTFGAGTSLSFCIPDRGLAIRQAISVRIFNLVEAARHAGTLIDAENAEEELEHIDKALGGHTISNTEGEFPW